MIQTSRSLLRRRSAACSWVLPQLFAGSVASCWTNVQVPPLVVDVQDQCRNGNSTVVSLWKTSGKTGRRSAKCRGYNVMVGKGVRQGHVQMGTFSDTKGCDQGVGSNDQQESIHDPW